MTKTLEMVFHNTDGKTVTISLADPRDNLTLAEVKTIMQEIITRNVFVTTGGDLAQIAEVQIRTNEAVPLV